MAFPPQGFPPTPAMHLFHCGGEEFSVVQLRVHGTEQLQHLRLHPHQTFRGSHLFQRIVEHYLPFFMTLLHTIEHAEKCSRTGPGGYAGGPRKPGWQGDDGRRSDIFLCRNICTKPWPIFRSTTLFDPKRILAQYTTVCAGLSIFVRRHRAVEQSIL